MNNEMIEKIDKKEALVGIVGLGYVGLPLLLCFVEKGFRTLGLDIDGQKTAALLQGVSYIRHIPSTRIAAAANSGRFDGRRACLGA